ncbi:hypothetical protein QBC39DRAFT_256134 [Podospora conica]|nr:hypothetical protein QBC39DRAFT_256134 [Schizothecium conicum]
MFSRFLSVFLLFTGVTLDFDNWDISLCPIIIKCDDACVILKADPDIGGIGVRTAAYILSLCSLLLFGLGSKYDIALRGTLVLTSLALVETVALFSLKTELSLQHAAVSLSLLTVVMLPLHFVESWRIDSPGLFVAQQVRLATYSAMQLWLAIQAPCFGSSPECNLCTRSTMFWVTFDEVHFLGRSFKVGAVFLVGVAWLNATLLTYGPLHSIQAVPAMFSETWAAEWAAFAKTTEGDLTAWRKKRVRVQRRKREWTRFAINSFLLWYEDNTPLRTAIEDRRWRRPPTRHPAPGWWQRVWTNLRLASTVPRFQRMIISLVFAVVYISNTELTVRANLDDEANGWGFGQILSMLAAVPFMASTIELAFRLGARDRSVRIGHDCG